MAGGLSAERAGRGGSASASGRAIAAIGVAVGGGALAVAFLPSLAVRAGVGSELGIGIAVALACLLLAFGGARALGLRIRFGWRIELSAMLPLGAVAFAVALGTCALGGHVSARGAAPNAGYGPALAALLLGALGEEALFRGLLQPPLCRAWRARVGLPLAALGFMLLHLAGGWRDPLSLANIALAGLWFGALEWRTGGIAAPFLAHAGWNWAEALLFGAFPNPGIDPAGSIFDVDLGGAAWLGGSGDGMNGALPTTLVLAALTLLTLRAGEGGAPVSDYAYLLHEPADAPRAAALLQALRAAKLDARGDASLAGDPDPAAAAEIEGAWLVIPLWSEHSTDREGPQAAYRAAEAPAQRGAYLGVLLDGVPPPFGFGGLQAVDLGRWGGGRDPKLEAFVDTVRQRLRSGPAGDMPDPVEIGARRERTAVIAGVVAVLLLLAAGGWWLARPMPSQRQAIDRELAAIPCSWLKVDPVDDGSTGTLALTGVADDPARAGEVIRGLVRGAAKPATVTTNRIARIGSNDCPAIDVPRRIRQDEGGRLRVISDSVGRDASSRLAAARVQLRFRGGDRTMALFGMEPNGEVTLIFPDYAALERLKDNPNPSIGYTHDDGRSYEFSLPANHTGWTGLLLVTGGTPLPPFDGHATPDSELLGMNSHEFADWLGRATAAGDWQAEMQWYEIHAR